MNDISYGNSCRNWNRCPAADIECPCNTNEGDVQIDLYPALSRPPVVWGTVYNNCNQPLCGGTIRLLQCSNDRNSCCILVGETCSDCNGYYEIPLPDSCYGNYRIEVNPPCNCRETQIRKNNICYY